MLFPRIISSRGSDSLGRRSRHARARTSQARRDEHQMTIFRIGSPGQTLHCAMSQACFSRFWVDGLGEYGGAQPRAHSRETTHPGSRYIRSASGLLCFPLLSSSSVGPLLPASRSPQITGGCYCWSLGWDVAESHPVVRYQRPRFGNTILSSCAWRAAYEIPRK